MDVVGLYQHIPHEEGLSSMKVILEEYCGKIHLSVPLGSWWIWPLYLGKQLFEFDGRIYRQKLGTAIGTTFAPAFANIFRSELEKKMLRNYHLEPWIWQRFPDDIFGIWLYGKEELFKFPEYINSFHNTISYI